MLRTRLVSHFSSSFLPSSLPPSFFLSPSDQPRARKDRPPSVVRAAHGKASTIPSYSFVSCSPPAPAPFLLRRPSPLALCGIWKKRCGWRQNNSGDGTLCRRRKPLCRSPASVQRSLGRGRSPPLTVTLHCAALHGSRPPRESI